MRVMGLTFRPIERLSHRFSQPLYFQCFLESPLKYVIMHKEYIKKELTSQALQINSNAGVHTVLPQENRCFDDRKEKKKRNTWTFWKRLCTKYGEISTWWGLDCQWRLYMYYSAFELVKGVRAFWWNDTRCRHVTCIVYYLLVLLIAWHASALIDKLQPWAA